MNARTEWGSTALMFAAEKGHVQCVNLFIGKGAKVNIRNNYGETALIYAAICGRTFLSTQILLKAGAKINICDVFGQNALENHLVENPFVNRQLAMLLFAAGEKPKGRRIYTYDTYRSGTVNSNTVNSKFHLIRSCCEYLARFLSFHV